jgi:hypothetical protein
MVNLIVARRVTMATTITRTRTTKTMKTTITTTKVIVIAIAKVKVRRIHQNTTTTTTTKQHPKIASTNQTLKTTLTSSLMTKVLTAVVNRPSWNNHPPHNTPLHHHNSPQLTLTHKTPISSST